MSLINQMLRDLEQRRTAEAGPSPLGGLSASGATTQSVNFSINYGTLTAVLAVLFLAGVVVAYLLGSQQQPALLESSSVRASEILPPVRVDNTAQTKVLMVELPEKVPPAVRPIIVPTVETTSIKEAAAKSVDEPVVGPIATMVIKPVMVDAVDDSINVIEEVPVDVEQDINKTIRPLTLEEQSQQAFQRAIKILGRGNQQNAQRALEEALSLAPTHLLARETLAALLLNAGRISEAAGSLRDGLQLMPTATPLAKLYARILVDQGDVPLALKVLERARPAVSADPDYYALLAALYRQEKKHAQAAQVYQQILMQRPGVASWWMGLALSQDAMGENEKALDAYQRAVRSGGLGEKIFQYMQARIIALTPGLPEPVNAASEFDEFGE